MYQNGKSLIKKENNWCVIDEPYIKEPMKKETFTTYPYFYNSISDITVGYKIEENEVFILGDNRNNSLDSRIYGTLNVDYICNIYWFNISENPFLNFIYKYFL